MAEITVNLEGQGGNRDYVNPLSGRKLLAVDTARFVTPGLLIEGASWERDGFSGAWVLVLSVWTPTGPMIEIRVTEDVLIHVTPSPAG
jgi:hypothetical protein